MVSAHTTRMENRTELVEKAKELYDDAEDAEIFTTDSQGARARSKLEKSGRHVNDSHLSSSLTEFAAQIKTANLTTKNIDEITERADQLMKEAGDA